MLIVSLHCNIHYSLSLSETMWADNKHNYMLVMKTNWPSETFALMLSVCGQSKLKSQMKKWLHLHLLYNTLLHHNIDIAS